MNIKGLKASRGDRASKGERETVIGCDIHFKERRMLRDRQTDGRMGDTWDGSTGRGGEKVPPPVLPFC